MHANRSLNTFHGSDIFAVGRQNTLPERSSHLLGEHLDMGFYTIGAKPMNTDEKKTANF